MVADRIRIRRWARWLGTFVGFPLAGVAARLAVGNIDSAGAAVVGGLVGGAVLGAVQVGIAGIEIGSRGRWIAATALGLGAGLAAGAAAVGYDTDPASLATMGALSGAGVGLAQALAVRMRLLDRVAWALATPALWAGAWLITSQVIVDADRQHALFGLPSGAAASAIAGILYALRQQAAQPATSLVASTGPVTA
jgi:hypothetical protein